MRPSSPHTGREPSDKHVFVRPPSLHLANPAWLQQPAQIPGPALPSQRQRKDGSIIYVPSPKETGSGQGYRRHAPTTCKVRFPSSSLPELSALVDTGASLSTIDFGLLQRLQSGTPRGESLCINGIGSQQTLGFVTLTFAIETCDSQGRSARLVFEHDFHVLPTFAPGVCLGHDWISGHRLVVDLGTCSAQLTHHFPARGTKYVFPVRSVPPPARTLSGKVCTKRAVVIPPACHFWVETDTAALLEDTDYMLEPTFLTDEGGFQAAMAIPSLIDRSMSRLLVTNFGDEPFELPSRTVLGQATACGPGISSTIMPVSFTLEGAPSDAISKDDGQPFDPFEFDEQPHAAASSSEATDLVDETWRVGKDDRGQPHAQIVHLLRRHKAAFSLDGRPGHVKGVAMEIPVPDASKLRADAPRRVSPEKRRAIDTQLQQLLEWDVIEDSSSPISAPVHLVRQKDKLRMCVDYRSLNAATTPDRYPLPRIDDVLESLRGASWFSSLDAIRGYHQTDVARNDRWKTAFITHRGLYQYKRVPFGLKSAPAFFQRFMDSLLGPMRWIVALVYLDDVVIYTRSLSEHIHALEQLFRAATSVGLRFSPSKCVFGVRELNLLGRKVSGFGLGVMQDRASAVADLSRPKTLKELYHSLGLLSYYRQFIPRFAQIAAPLYDFLKGWSYGKAGTAPKLTRQDGTTTSAEKEILKWERAHQESFDTLKAALVSPPTLAHPDYSRPFLLYTDACKTGFAAAIHQIHVLPVDSGATVMSAFPTLGSPLDRQDWLRQQRSDPVFGPVLRRLDSDADQRADEIYALVDGLLVRRDDGRVCVPRAALLGVLQREHDHGGHFGFAKTYARIAAQFWHPRLSSLVEAYVRYCETCQQTKRARRVGALDIDNDADRPFQHMSIDVVLGMPRSRGRYDAVIVAVDTFSKMILLGSTSSAFTAREITQFVLDRIVRLGWRPQRLTSDHDLRIIGDVGQELARFLGMEITATPPHHHRANPVERHVQTITRVLRSMATSGGGTWDEGTLAAVELAVNSTPSLATGISPFDAIFIDSPKLVDSLLLRRDHSGVESWSERFELARKRLHDAQTLIRIERQKQRRQFDARHAPLPNVSPGQKAWIRLTDRPVRAAPSGKLAPTKMGPYPIVRVLSPHRVVLDVPPELNIDGEFDLSQLDLQPDGADPFADEKVKTATPPPTPRQPPPDPIAELQPPRRGSRVRRQAPLLLDPQMTLYAARPELGAPLHIHKGDAFTQPLHRSKIATIDGVEVRLVERPVAFMSRATSTSEARLAGPELELACIAWAFTRAQHLLEGAQVTIVTDHAPIPGMLTSRPGAVPYGAPVERVRTVLRPHLDNMKFVYKPGPQHINVDALSRLVVPPSSPGTASSLQGGRVAE